MTSSPIPSSQPSQPQPAKPDHKLEATTQDTTRKPRKQIIVYKRESYATNTASKQKNDVTDAIISLDSDDETDVCPSGPESASNPTEMDLDVEKSTPVWSDSVQSGPSMSDKLIVTCPSAASAPRVSKFSTTAPAPASVTAVQPRNPNTRDVRDNSLIGKVRNVASSHTSVQNNQPMPTKILRGHTEPKTPKPPQDSATSLPQKLLITRQKSATITSQETSKCSTVTAPLTATSKASPTCESKLNNENIHELQENQFHEVVSSPTPIKKTPVPTKIPKDAADPSTCTPYTSKSRTLATKSPQELNLPQKVLNMPPNTQKFTTTSQKSNIETKKNNLKSTKKLRNDEAIIEIDLVDNEIIIEDDSKERAIDTRDPLAPTPASDLRKEKKENKKQEEKIKSDIPKKITTNTKEEKKEKMPYRIKDGINKKCEEGKLLGTVDLTDDVCKSKKLSKTKHAPRSSSTVSGSSATILISATGKVYNKNNSTPATKRCVLHRLS